MISIRFMWQWVNSCTNEHLNTRMGCQFCSSKRFRRSVPRILFARGPMPNGHTCHGPCGGRLRRYLPARLICMLPWSTSCLVVFELFASQFSQRVLPPKSAQSVIHRQTSGFLGMMALPRGPVSGRKIQCKIPKSPRCEELISRSNQFPAWLVEEV